MPSRNKRCDALMVGVLVAASPLIVVKRTSEHIHDRHDDRKQRALVLAGDPGAMGQCVLMCNEYSHLEAKERRQLLDTSVEWVLTHWDTAPEPGQLPALMNAHYLRGVAVAEQNPALASTHWQRAAAIAADPAIVGGLEVPDYGANAYNIVYYNDLLIDIHALLLLQRHKVSATNIPDADDLQEDCHPDAAWPPAWANKYNTAASLLRQACSRAYQRAYPEAPLHQHLAPGVDNQTSGDDDAYLKPVDPPISDH